MPIAALNSKQNQKDNEGSGDSFSCLTKEAQETEAIACYNKVLRLQKDGFFEEAGEAYLKLLKNPFLSSENGTRSEHKIARTSVLLKYAIYKNLALVYEKRNKIDSAIKFCFKALRIDATDVTMWFKVGKFAEKISNFGLARHGYEMAFKRNPDHLPSAIKLVMLHYVYENYETCLHYISVILEKNKHFLVGLVLRKQILMKAPYLKEWSRQTFRNCDINLLNTEIPDEEYEKILNNVEELKIEVDSLVKFNDISEVSFDPPLVSFNMVELGRGILSLYDQVQQSSKSNSNVSLSSRVNIEASINMKSCEKTLQTSISDSIINDNETHERTYSQTQSVAVSEPEQSEAMDVDDEICVDAKDKNETADEANRDEISNKRDNDSGTDVKDCPDHLLTPSLSANALAAEGFTNQEIDYGKKRGKKRKLFLLFADEPDFKRRSSRVKNPARSKSIEAVDNSIRKLLPGIFQKYFELEQDVQQTATVSSSESCVLENVRNESRCSPEVEVSFENETEIVSNFLQNLKNVNVTVIELMRIYLVKLQEMFQLRWPGELVGIFLECFERLRIHITFDSYMNNDVCMDEKQDLAKICLAYVELKIDDFLKANTTDHSESSSQLSSSMEQTDKSNINFLAKEMRFLENMTFGVYTGEHIIRAFWILSKVFQAKKMFDYSLSYINQTLNLMQANNIDVINLPNCKNERLISQGHVERVKNSVERGYSIEGLQKIFDDEDYKQVVELLGDVFASEDNVNLESEERRCHMEMFLESHAAVCSYEKCFYWSEVSINEVVKAVLKSRAEQVNLSGFLDQCFFHLKICMDELNDQTCLLPNFVRLVNNLVTIVEEDLFESSKVANEANVIFTSSWKFLYQLVKWYEMAEEKISQQEDDNDDEEVPCHIRILMSAHEHLGRKGCCTMNNGEFLHFLINQITDKLRADDSLKSELVYVLEQAFHCIYGYPSRKGRSRYLEDHSSTQIPLDWTNCEALYEFFKPDYLPEYDSYKTSTISTEVEGIFLKIKDLAPAIDNIRSIQDQVELYILGTYDQIPVTPATDNLVLKDIYYLLADFYFKNSDNKKALEYYVLDLVMCPDRFDSWAALALTHSSFISDILSKHDLRPDLDVVSLMEPPLKCFERALNIDPTNSKLWIEYGSFAYLLHSHFSSRKKQGLLDDDQYKEKMLELSSRCFESARQHDIGSGEEWLEHYMLGKAAEKSDKSPEVYLEHYYKAGNFLHLEKAKYPKKSISYYNPPHLAVESLEMFYRTHASTLKYLMKHEHSIDTISYEVFEKYLKLAWLSPLVQGQEHQDKKPEKRTEQCEEDNSDKGKQESEDAENSKNDLPSTSHSSQENSSEYLSQKCCGVVVESERNENTDGVQASTNSFDNSIGINLVVEEENGQNFETNPQRSEEIQHTACGGIFIDGDVDMGADQPLNADQQLNENRQLNVSQQLDGANKEEATEKNNESETNSKENSKSGSAEGAQKTNAEKYMELIQYCSKAFCLILSRYPWHFKSTYRLAHMYFHSKFLKSVVNCKQLLLGQSFLIPFTDFKCNGLFHDRKPNNFFNGLWRLPSTELDRCGSFSSHLYRSITLLLQVLKTIEEPKLIFYLHQQLAKCPENATKKYLRDYVREMLSTRAFLECCLVLNQKLERLESSCESTSSLTDLLIDIFHIKQQVFRMSTKQLDSMMVRIYKIIYNVKEGNSTNMEEIKRFCLAQQHSKIFRQSASLPVTISLPTENMRGADNLNSVQAPKKLPNVVSIHGKSIEMQQLKTTAVENVNRVNHSYSFDGVEIVDEAPKSEVNNELQRRYATDHAGRDSNSAVQTSPQTKQHTQGAGMHLQTKPHSHVAGMTSQSRQQSHTTGSSQVRDEQHGMIGTSTQVKHHPVVSSHSQAKQQYQHTGSSYQSNMNNQFRPNVPKQTFSKGNQFMSNSSVEKNSFKGHDLLLNKGATRGHPKPVRLHLGPDFFQESGRPTVHAKSRPNDHKAVFVPPPDEEVIVLSEDSD